MFDTLNQSCLCKISLTHPSSLVWFTLFHYCVIEAFPSVTLTMIAGQALGLVFVQED